MRMLIGVAPQEIALYEAMTARENLVLFSRLHGLGRNDAKQRANELLDRVGLADRAHHRVAGFSGGMKRRLNLAAALVGEPKLVLLDEPTAGVDPQSRNAIFDMVAQLKDAGVTVLFSTHYMEEAARLCDRVAIVDHGRLLALGTVGELIETHGGPSMVVVRRHGQDEERTATTAPLDELSRLIADHGPTIAELRRVLDPDRAGAPALKGVLAGVRVVLVLAAKDVRLLSRDRVALFFTLVFPLLFGILFGAVFSGSAAGDGPRALDVAIVDLDGSNDSRGIVARLSEGDQLSPVPVETAAEARELVRTGVVEAYFVFPEGFGEAATMPFGGTPMRVEIGSGPSGRGTRAMLTGIATQAVFEQFGEGMLDPERSRQMVREARDLLADADGVDP
ncbi:Linearmycin resistance ATP-binding protein LnrL, partial [Durusdinium trenchii]